jgi:hypothetical protein
MEYHVSLYKTEKFLNVKSDLESIAPPPNVWIPVTSVSSWRYLWNLFSICYWSFNIIWHLLQSWITGPGKLKDYLTNISNLRVRLSDWLYLSILPLYPAPPLFQCAHLFCVSVSQIKLCISWYVRDTLHPDWYFEGHMLFVFFVCYALDL